MGDLLSGPKPKTPTGPSIGPVSPRLINPLVPWQTTGVAAPDALPRPAYQPPAPVQAPLFPQQDATAVNPPAPPGHWDELGRSLLHNAVPLKPFMDAAHDYVDQAVATHGHATDEAGMRLLSSAGELAMALVPAGPEARVPLEGSLALRELGNEEVQGIARRYVTDAGIQSATLPRTASVHPQFMRRMAEAYDGLLSTPEKPAVKQAYQAFTNEVDRQYQAIHDAGYRVEFTDHDPYPNSRAMLDDVRQNHRLQVFKSPSSAHPLLTADQNDRFRAVHDFFGHAASGNQFGPIGEENAYRDHAAMFSDDARAAMGTETRGQNSWFNYGPHALLPPKERPFAVQKAALWPDELQGEYPTLRFEHYSPTEGLSSLEPQSMGAPGGLGVKGEQARAARGGYDLLPRSYAYLTGAKPEDRLVGLHKYAGELPSTKVADIASMPDIQKMVSNNEDFERALQAKGYAGYRNTQSAMPHALALFEPTPVSAAERGPLPRVLGSSPENAYRPAPFYHGTIKEGFDVPTKGDLGVHLGTEDQALHRIASTWGAWSKEHADMVEQGQELVANKEARLLKFYPKTNTPLRALGDAGFWDNPENAAAELRPKAEAPTDFHFTSPRYPLMGGKDLYAWSPEGIREGGPMGALRHELDYRGHGSVEYPNGVEGPGLSTIVLHPERTLSKTPTRFGEPLSTANVRGLGVEGAHHLVENPNLTHEQWANKMSQQFPDYATELHGDAGARAFAHAQKKAESIGSLASFEHVNALAHSATGQETRNWYAEWWPKISAALGDHDADMLTRFSSILSAQKSPAEEARLALTAFWKYQDALDAQGVDESGRLFRKPNWGALGTTPQRETQLTLAADGDRWAKSAPKTSNYYLARRGSPNAVTIDRHIARAYRGSEEISDEHYAVLAARIRHDAARAGVSPRDYQAMVWGGQTGYPYRPPESFFAEHLASGDFGPLLDRNPGLQELARSHEPEAVRAPALRLKDDPQGHVGAFDGEPGETHDELFHRLGAQGVLEPTPQVRKNFDDIFVTNWGRHVTHPRDIEPPPF